jgi:hypothetical protein
MGHHYCNNMLPAIILSFRNIVILFTSTWECHPRDDLYFISFLFYSSCYSVRLCFPIPFPRASSNKRNTTHSFQSHVAINFKLKGTGTRCSEREKNACLHKSLSWHLESGYWNNNFIVFRYKLQVSTLSEQCSCAYNSETDVISLNLVSELKQHTWYEAKCWSYATASHSSRALERWHVITILGNYVRWISI